MDSELEVYITESVIRCHHVYKRVWRPVVGEILPVDAEEDNVHNRNAVAVRSGAIVGHLPRELSRTVWYCVAFKYCVLVFANGRKTRNLAIIKHSQLKSGIRYIM